MGIISNSILLVDDNETVILYEKAILRPLGCRLEIARNGVKALELVAKIASLGATLYALYSLLLTNNFKEFAKFVKKTEDLLEVDECAENDQYDDQNNNKFRHAYTKHC